MNTEVLWSGAGSECLDRCQVSPTGNGFRIAGTVLRADRDGPFEIRYSVAVDGEWRTRVVGVHVRGPDRDDRVALAADGEGAWSSGDDPVEEFAGCIDVDFEFTPATNLLPIRRLALDVGAGADVDAAWVRFPDRKVERLSQRYTRTGAREYRYESADFAALLTVDDDGLVVSYGDLWRRVGGPGA